MQPQQRAEAAAQKAGVAHEWAAVVQISCRAGGNLRRVAYRPQVPTPQRRQQLPQAPQCVWPTRTVAPAGVREAARPRARGPFTPPPSFPEPLPAMPVVLSARVHAPPAARSLGGLHLAAVRGLRLPQVLGPRDGLGRSARGRPGLTGGFEEPPDAGALQLVLDTQAIEGAVKRRLDGSVDWHGDRLLWPR